MKKILLIALSNIRKNKGGFLSLTLLVLIAALLLNLGLLTFFNFSRFFDQKAEELHSAHMIAATVKSNYQDSYLEYLADYPGVTETAKEGIQFLPSAQFLYNEGTFSNSVLLLNADAPRSLSPFTLIGDALSADDQSIYLPLLLKMGGGYQLGDDFVLTVGEKNFTFRVAGFTEDILLGSINGGGIGLHLPDAAYRSFCAENEGFDGILLSARMTNSADAEKLAADFQNSAMPNDNTAMFSSSTWIQEINLMKTARTLTASIGSMIIVAFAAIIVLIGLIVIRFRVTNSIEDDMTSIGALKAMGYTSRQVIASLVVQFSLCAIAGGVFGIGLSYAALPSLSQMFAAQTGLFWTQGFDPGISCASFAAILLAVIAVAIFSARRIHKLHPIIALRGGITTHSFRKNHFPLETSKGNVGMLLALKTMAQNLKQNLTIAIIVAALTFGGVFAVVMYYNVCVVRDSFYNMVVGEVFQLDVLLVPDADADQLLKELRSTDGVAKALYYDMVNVDIEKSNLTAYVTEDYSLTVNQMVYEGRSPRHENEVALGTQSYQIAGKGIGDTVTIKMGNQSKDFLVTGLIQSPNYAGRDLQLTYAGAKRLNPDYKRASIYLYLNHPEDTAVLAQELSAQYPDEIRQVIDMQEMMNSQLGVYFSIVSIIAVVILSVTALVIMLILYLVVKTLILRKRRELGVQKALGFTTLQLMNQIAFSFLPTVILGTAAGGLLGCFGINTALSFLFQGIGIMKTYFLVPPGWMAILCTIICAVAYAVAMLVARRIRRISPYSLITE